MVTDTPDPRFATEEGRRAFREAVAGAVVRGELSSAIAAVALRACVQAEERPPESSTGRKRPNGPFRVHYASPQPGPEAA